MGDAPKWMVAHGMPYWFPMLSKGVARRHRASPTSSRRNCVSSCTRWALVASGAGQKKGDNSQRLRVGGSSAVEKQWIKHQIWETLFISATNMMNSWCFSRGVSGLEYVVTATSRINGVSAVVTQVITREVGFELPRNRQLEAWIMGFGIPTMDFPIQTWSRTELPPKHLWDTPGGVYLGEFTTSKVTENNDNHMCHGQNMVNMV